MSDTQEVLVSRDQKITTAAGSTPQQVVVFRVTADARGLRVGEEDGIQAKELEEGVLVLGRDGILLCGARRRIFRNKRRILDVKRVRLPMNNAITGVLTIAFIALILVVLFKLLGIGLGL